MPETLHQILRYTHIIFGFLGLIIFWVPIFTKKGGRIHIITGKIFAGSAYIVAISAILSWTWAITSVHTFTSKLPSDPIEQKNTIHFIHFFLSILAWLSILVIINLRLGLSAISTRRNPEQFNSQTNRAITYLLLVASLGLFLLVIIQTITLGFFTRHYIPLALGIIGVLNALGTLKVLRTAWPTKMGWWYFHTNCMFACGIAFHTAFLLFGLQQFVKLEGFVLFLAWTLPTVIGVAASILTERHYRRKFGELTTPSSTATTD